MATPLSAARAVAALKAEGLRVIETPNWRKHNRGARGDGWGPVHGVLLHHTASRGDTAARTQSSVALCRDGYAELPGPLCHGVIAKDGTVHMVGWGRANHAGAGDGDVIRAVTAERPLPEPNQTDTDGNARLYGFECINLGDGKDPWPPEQVDAAVRAATALLRAHGWGKSGDTSVLGHLEFQPGKPDPRGPGFPGMNAIRRRVAERLTHEASWSPDAPAPATYTVVAKDTLTSIARAHHTTVAALVRLNRLTDADHITPGQKLVLPQEEA